jgi:hypothetical protein
MRWTGNGNLSSIRSRNSTSSLRFGAHTPLELEFAVSRPPPCLDTIPARSCKCPSGPVHMALPLHMSGCLYASEVVEAAAAEEAFAAPYQQLVWIAGDHASGSAHFEFDAIQARVAIARRPTQEPAGISWSPVSGLASCLSRQAIQPSLSIALSPFSQRWPSNAAELTNRRWIPDLLEHLHPPQPRLGIGTICIRVSGNDVYRPDSLSAECLPSRRMIRRSCQIR